MSDADHGHAPTAHDDGHDGHGHQAEAEALGPVDLVAWGYSIAAGLVGVAVALALYVATGR